MMRRIGWRPTSRSIAAFQKPRVWSFAANYTGGPLRLGAGYQRHNEVGTFNGAGAAELDDKAWGAVAGYTFGPVRAGVTYMRRKWETTTGDIRKDTWTLGAEWNIAGPHEIHLGYGKTGDSKGSSLTGISATTQGGVPAPGSETGYQAFSIAYQYSFSKRTLAKIGYIRMENDDNSSALRANNGAALLSNGQTTDGVTLLFKHRF